MFIPKTGSHDVRVALHTRMNVLMFVVGLLIVGFATYRRFSNPPLRLLTLTPSNKIDVWRKLFEHWYPLSKITFAPPPRSHTTAFRFWMFTWLYVVVWAVIYTGLNHEAIRIKFSPLLTMLFSQFNVTATEQWTKNFTTPLLLAMMVAFLLPAVVGRLDWTFRLFLYGKALIPAERITLEARLNDCIWFPPLELVAQLNAKLSADTSQQVILRYEQKASTLSIWTKTSTLIEKLRQASAIDSDIAGSLEVIEFFCARTRERKNLSRAIESEFSRLKKAAVSVIQMASGTPEKVAFKEECVSLLRMIYQLISQLTLHCKSSEADRTKLFREFGFRYRPLSSSPLPTLDQFTWFLVLIVVTAAIPIYQLLVWGGNTHPLLRVMGITVQILIASLTPFILAAYRPRLLQRNGTHPPIFFPLLSGIVAGALAMIVSLVEKLLGNILDARSLHDSLLSAWDEYSTRSYYYTVLLSGTAILLTFRILCQCHHTVNQRFGRHINFKDAMWFIALAALVNAWLIYDLGLPRWEALGRLIVGVLVIFAIGLFVPTWFRCSRVDNNPKYDEAMTKVVYAMKLDRVLAIFEAYGLPAGQKALALPGGNPEFLEDAQIASAEGAAYFYLWRPTSNWIFIVGFNNTDQVVFRSAGQIET